MTYKQWLLLVFLSGQGLYKNGSMGREVHEFEIEAALEAQKTFALLTGSKPIRITGLQFETPAEKATYRSITEQVHRTMKAEPDLMESAWVNVWHSVAEASYLVRQLDSKFNVAGFAAYLAYCRECRDWEPSPPMFSELSPRMHQAWKAAETMAGDLMAEGFGKSELDSEVLS